MPFDAVAPTRRPMTATSWTEAVRARRAAVAESGQRVWLVLLATLLGLFAIMQAVRQTDALWLGSTITLDLTIFVAATFALIAALPGALPPALRGDGRVGGVALVVASLCVALLDAGAVGDARHLLLAVFGVGFAMLVPMPAAPGIAWLVASALTWPVTHLLASPAAWASIGFAQRFVDLVASTCIAAVALLAHRWVFRGRTAALRDLAALAEHDGLTGALNRRTIMQRLAAEAHRVDRHGGALGVVLLDVDRFKRFNTELGYAAGDRMLVEVATALRDVLDQPDWAGSSPVVGRYGGEEFIVLLPDATAARLLELADACRAAIAGRVVDWQGQPVRVTASVGAFLLEAGAGVRSGSALGAADAAMYRAKSAGGDCVVVGTPEDAPATSTEPGALAPAFTPPARVETASDVASRRLHALILRALLLLGAAWTLLFGLLDIGLERAIGDAFPLGFMLVTRAACAVLGVVLAWLAVPLDRGERRVAGLHVFIALSMSLGIVVLMGMTGGLVSPYFSALVWLALAWSIAFAAPPLPAMVTVALVALALPMLVPYTAIDDAATYPLLHRIVVLLAAGFVAVGAERRFTRLRQEEAAARSLLDQMARVDPLTGLPNRVAVMDRAERLARRTPRTAPLSLVLFDLDHFKRLNDTLGHLVGDEALSSVAGVVTSTVRGGDVPGRLGGEEFVVVASHTDIAGAALLAERLRARIAELVLSDGETRLTASFGVALVLPGEGAAEALARADRALRQAKLDGRNRVALDPLSRDQE